MNDEEKQHRKEHRAKVMSPEIQRFIAARAESILYVEEDGQIITDRRIIAEKLIAEIQEKFPDENTPSSETLTHIISKVRTNKVSPLQDIWTMSTLKDYPLPSDTIPHVVEVNKYSSQKALKFSIRQAIWVSRLCHVVPKVEDLYEISLDYALAELISEDANKLNSDNKTGSFDTQELDKALPDVVAVQAAFEKLIDIPGHFIKNKLAFNELTGLNLQGIIVLTQTLYQRSDKLYPVVIGEQLGLPGEKRPVTLPLIRGTAKEVLPKLKLAKSSQKKRSPDFEGYIDLSVPLAIKVSQKELQQIKDGYPALKDTWEKIKEG
jgi:hypothetical protein